MKKHEVALRAQDIQTGLQEVNLRGPAAGLFDTTLLTGMAARLAIHIRGIEIIEEEQRLRALGTRLGIPSLVLRNVLDILEEVEFIQVEYDGQRPKRVVERVPYYDDLYGRLGAAWEIRQRSEEEEASVLLLDRLAAAPENWERIEAEYGLDASQLRVVQEVGEAGGYLGRFESPTDGSIVVYSPLYWEENPEETLRLIQKYGGARVAQAIRSVRSYQGMPLPDLGAQSTEDDRIVVEAMVAGLLPAPEVNSFRGPRRFAFTPYKGKILLSDKERAILQKARAILACIRYGQHFGSITKIKDPDAILRTLKGRGRIGAHSEIAVQYAILVVEGVARISRDTAFRSRYHLELIDTPENRKALDVAADVLTVGETITDRGLDPGARSILLNAGLYKEALTSRSEELARRQRQPAYSDETVKKELEKLVDDIRGVGS